MACCSAFLLLSSSSLLLASSSCVRGLGAGLGGIAGSWMKGCEGWTWVDDEPGMAGDTDEGLLRSWAETQGCTTPGRSTEVGRGDSLLGPVLLEPLVLPLEKQQRRRQDECQRTQNIQKRVLLQLRVMPIYSSTNSQRTKESGTIRYAAGRI